MRETIYRLEQLRNRRAHIETAPQTVEREMTLTRLDMDIEILDCAIRSKVAERVLVFLESWRKTGRFTAIRQDGARMDADPVVTGIPVQDFWNVRGEAHRLARWSFGLVFGGGE